MVDLPAIRRKALTVRTYARTGKVFPAIQALHETLVAVMSSTLLKAEKEEFNKLIEDGAAYIMAIPECRNAAAVNLTFSPGKEQELLEGLKLLMKVFHEDIKETAQEQLKLLEERRRTLLVKGEAYLGKEKLEEAKKTFTDLLNLFPKSPNLHGEIADLYLKYGLYEEAITHYTPAIEMDPSVAGWYNSIAICFRKMKNFSLAERYYLKVSTILGKDPHLFFNLARLYIDWEQWAKAIKAGQGALKLDPEFEQSQKLVRFAEKKLAEQQNKKS